MFSRGVAVLAFSLSCFAAFAQESTYYVVAHEDDWQLFMGGNAYEDVAGGHKVTFIYLTAGDAGSRTGGYGTIGYYRAREEAAKASVRLPASLSNIEYLTDTFAYATVNRKKVMKWTHLNTVSYFLRLPDGAPDGAGFAANGNQSLMKLKKGQITKLTSVDGLSTYTGWSDVVNTVKAILLAHQGTDSDIWINAPDVDETINVGSHSDHYAAGAAAIQAGVGIPGANFALWEDYSAASHGANLPRTQYMMKAGLFGALASTLWSYKYESTWDPFHTAYLDRGYFRVRQPSEPIP